MLIPALWHFAEGLFYKENITKFCSIINIEKFYYYNKIHCKISSIRMINEVIRIFSYIKLGFEAKKNVYLILYFKDNYGI